MKRSELKQLIKEVIQEAEAAELKDMIKALEQNPEFVDAAWEKLQTKLANIQLGTRKANQLKKSGGLSEQDAPTGRRSFIKNLAVALLGAGLGVNQIQAAKSPEDEDIFVQMARAQIELMRVYAEMAKFNRDMTQRNSEMLRQQTKDSMGDAYKGSTEHIHDELKDNIQATRQALKKYIDGYKENKGTEKAQEYIDQITTILWNTYMKGNDWDKFNKNFRLATMMASIAGINDHTLFEKSLKKNYGLNPTDN